VPYRQFLGDLDQEFFPRIQSPAEASSFVDKARPWFEDASNWIWVWMPLTAIGLPIATWIVRVPSLLRARQRDRRRTGPLVDFVSSISAAIQNGVDACIDGISHVAVALNRGLANVADVAITLVLGVADSILRLVALAIIGSIPTLAFIVPGLKLHNPALVGWE
jgi:hypothetical protein